MSEPYGIEPFDPDEVGLLPPEDYHQHEHPEEEPRPSLTERLSRG